MSGRVELVFPPAGIALAALLLFGVSYWPGVAAGAIVFSMLNGMSLGLFTVGMVCGNTIGAIICVYLLERFVGFRSEMDRVKDVAGLVGLACVLGTTVNATFNAVSLGYGGQANWADLLPTVLEWWVPNAMACLVVTPLLLSWSQPWDWKIPVARWAEGSVCASGLVASTMVSFASWYVYGIQNYPLAFLPYPFLVWSSLRFGRRGATASTAVVSVLAIHSLLQGRGPFVTGVEKESLFLMGSYMGILAITNLMLAAAAAERQAAERALQRSEEVLDLIGTNATDLIAVTDATGKRLFNSASYKRLLGEPATLEGTSAFADVHPDDKPKVKGIFDETLRTGKGHRCEFRFLLKDGTVRFIESEGSFVPGVDGRPGKVITVARDITERRSQDEYIRILASALYSADDSIVITTCEFSEPGPRIVYVNPAFTRMTGYSEAEAMAATPRLLQGQKTDRGVLLRLRKCLEKEQSFRGEVVNYRKDGTEFINELHVEPVRDAQGNVTHYLAVQRDVTEQKAVAQELARARDEALQSAKAKADFLANMSHEIRTPMNGVLGMIELLLQTNLDPAQLDYATSIRSSANSLLRVINNILDFSKVEAGKLSVEVADFNLQETVESTLQLLSQQAAAKGLELAGIVYPDIPTMLRGDSSRIRQLLNNLLGNAIKFTASGEVTLRVSKLREDRQSMELRFEVKDTGIGISAEKQAKLFKAFHQADTSTTRQFGGTGLGLAISKLIVEQMGGQIGMESTPGTGSTFWFTLTLGRLELDIEPQVVCPPDIADARVLIVDDNAANRQLLQHQALTWKMRFVNCASSADEALEMLRESGRSVPFAVAIIDQEMPDMDGLSLANLLRENPSTTNTKIVLLTSVGREISNQALAAARIDACVTKPIKQQRLYETLVAVLRGQPVPPHQSERSALAPVPQQGKPVEKRPVRMLLVEDNIINQKVAMAQLKELGYQPDIANHGQEALDAAKSKEYDVIFMDCQMPVLDGYEATRQIRLLEQTASERGVRSHHVYIIAMTANAMRGDREKCLSVGMNDYVSKPVSVEELRRALQRSNVVQPGMENETPSPAARPAPAEPSVPAVGSTRELPKQKAASTSAATPTQREKANAPQPQSASPSPAAPAEKSAPSPAGFDLKRLRKICGEDREKIREMISLYLDQSDDLLAQIVKAFQSKDASEAAKAAHKYSGSASSVGIDAVVPSLRSIEKLAKEGTLGLATPDLESLQRAHAAAREFLRGTMESQPQVGAAVTPVGGETADPGTTFTPKTDAKPAPAEPSSAPPSGGPGNAVAPADLSLVKKVCGNDDARVRDLVELFQTSSRELVAEIHEAFVKGDLETAGRAAHKLCGGAGSCGFQSIVPALREFERQCKQHELAGIEDLEREISQGYDLLDRSLQAALGELGSTQARAATSAPARPTPLTEVQTPAATPAQVPTTTPATPARDGAVNWKRLRRVCMDNPERMREMVEIYLAQAAELLAVMEKSLQAGSAQELGKAAHKLGGSSSSCGMEALLPCIRRLEQLGREDRLADAEAPLNEAKTEFGRVQAELKNWLASN